MERNGRLSINRILCLYIIVNMTHFLGLTSRIEQNGSGFLTVAALLMDKRTLRKQCYSLAGRERRNPFSSRVNSGIGGCSSDKNTSRQQHSLMAHRVAVIGGGLAGLSTAYHLLEKSPFSDITIIDQQSPGAGGASAVAGG